LEGIHSSQGHVLLNMRYNTTLIAIIGWLKPCLTGIECWIPAERSKFNAVLRAVLNVDCSAENFTSSTQHYKHLKIAQILIKKNVMMDMQKTHFSYNLNNFWTDMSSLIDDWSHVWLALSVDCRRKCYKIDAAKQTIRDLSASFNWLKYIFGHVKYPF